jgi:hypothetical protein
LKYLDEQLQEIEENDPSSIGTPAVVRKVLIRLKKLVFVGTHLISFGEVVTNCLFSLQAKVANHASPLGFDMECPCCSREMNADATEKFSKSIDSLLDENTSKLLNIDHAAVEKFRTEKSTYQRWRKVIEDNVDDVRDFNRMNDEWTEVETAIERLQADLDHHQTKANEQNERLVESQPAADELRGLVDAAKRGLDANVR